MPGDFNPAQIDYSWIGDIGDSAADGLASYQDNRYIADAWKQTGGDYNKAMQMLHEAGHVRAAAKAAKIHSLGDEGINRYGMQLIWGEDGTAYQPMSGGGVAPVNVPGGGKLKEPYTYVQTPQGVYPMPKNNVGGRAPQAPQGAPSGQGYEPPVYATQKEADAAGANVDSSQFIPKDYVTPEAQKEIGDSQGKAVQAMPAAEAMKNRVIGSITRLEKNPNLSSAIGPIQSRLPTYSDKTADVEAEIEQAIGGTFTTAYESLRGAQAITDVEGAKATAAITRLQNLKQSDPGYRRALADAKYEVFDLYNIVRKKAGAPTEENPYPKPSLEPVTYGGSSSGSRTSRGIQWSIEP